MSQPVPVKMNGADPQHAVSPAPFSQVLEEEEGYLGYPINGRISKSASNIINDIMEGLGLNTVQLSVVLGVSASLISRWRLSRYKISPAGRTKLKALAEYINRHGELRPEDEEALKASYGREWSQLGKLDRKYAQPQVGAGSTAPTTPPVDLGSPPKDRWDATQLVWSFVAGAITALGIGMALGRLLWL